MRDLRERYPVVEPYAYVEIEDAAPPVYHVVEVEISDEEKRVLDSVMNQMMKQMQETMNRHEQRRRDERENEGERQKIRDENGRSASAVNGMICSNASDVVKMLKELLEEYDLNEDQRGKIEYFVMRNMGYGDLDVLFRDDRVEDIYCVLGEPVRIFHQNYGCIQTNLTFDAEKLYLLLQKAHRCTYKNENDETEEEKEEHIKREMKHGMRSALSEAFLRHVSENLRKKGSLMYDLGGARMIVSFASESAAADAADAAGGGALSISIRKQRDVTPIDLLIGGVLSLEMLAYLWMAVQHRFNILIIGEPASGKTSMLRALSMFIPYNRRIVTIEDVRELNLNHCVSFISTDARSAEDSEMSLFNVAMKQRPDHVIIGEINSKMSVSMFLHTISSGVPIMSTMNAAYTNAIAERLIALGIPLDMLRYIDVVPVLRFVEIDDSIQHSSGDEQNEAMRRKRKMRASSVRRRRRRCVQIEEIVDVDHEHESIIANELFLWKPPDEFAFKGESQVFVEIMNRFEIDEEELTEDFTRRTDILDALWRKRVRSSDYIRRIMYEYEVNPDETVRKVLKS